MKKTILLGAIVVFAMAARGQNNAVLIQNGTSATELKKSVKVMTYNDTIFAMLMKEEKQHILRFMTYLKDNNGEDSGVHWTIYFKTEALEEIKDFFKRHHLSSI
jgi:hypothetical protein